MQYKFRKRLLFLKIIWDSEGFRNGMGAATLRRGKSGTARRPSLQMVFDMRCRNAKIAARFFWRDDLRVVRDFGVGSGVNCPRRAREWDGTTEERGSAGEAHRRWPEGCSGQASCLESYTARRGAGKATAAPPQGNHAGWARGQDFLLNNRKTVWTFLRCCK